MIATAASVDVGVTAGTIRANAPAGDRRQLLHRRHGAVRRRRRPTAGLTGNVVVGLDPADGSGPLTTDGCSPLTNAAAVAGNIALIDRGTCGFIVKVKNAQNAGAIAVIIANNSPAAVLRQHGRRRPHHHHPRGDDSSPTATRSGPTSPA